MPGRALTRSIPAASRASWLVALLLLLAVAGAFAQDAFLHTDDGCAVEVHCTACLWAQTVTSPGVALGVPAPVLVPAGAPVVDSATHPREARLAVGPARAPPLA